MIALAGAAHLAGAEMFGEAYKPCGDRASTPGIVECVGRKTREWDKRLNTSYGTLLGAAEGRQREALRTAQRQWVQFRDGNCAYYGSAPGTISQVGAAECLRSMTQDRAVELEQALRP